MTGSPAKNLHRDQKNTCFGCGLGNPSGMQLDFHPETVDGRPGAAATIDVAKKFTGAPTFLHGGIVATILDEAMAKANAVNGIIGVTHRLEVSYRRPVPAEEPVVVSGVLLRKAGRYAYNRAEIRTQNGKLLAEGKGRFVLLSREDIDRLGRAK